jgi:hypothetical protein
MAVNMDAIDWPPHLGGLFVSHNPHKANYETLEEWSRDDVAEWVSDDERERAIATDSVWAIQWYPRTPIGFCCVAASTLSAALAYALAD